MTVDRRQTPRRRRHACARSARRRNRSYRGGRGHRCSGFAGRPPQRRPDTPSPARPATTATPESPPAVVGRTPRPRRTVEVQPLLDHRAVAAPHPDDAARAATRTALGQRRLARIVRRGVRCRPAHRRAVRVLIRRIRAAPIERQHHRTPRAVNSPSAAGRRLAVHRPNRTRSPCHSSTATAPARGCSPAGTATHTTMLTTSHEHSAAFIASPLPCPRGRWRPGPVQRRRAIW